MSLPETMQGAMLLAPERIEIRDLPVPKPGDGEILLKVEAATTCGTDVKVFKRGGHPRMLTVPTLFGHEMAGRLLQPAQVSPASNPAMRWWLPIPHRAVPVSHAAWAVKTCARTCII